MNYGAFFGSSGDFSIESLMETMAGLAEKVGTGEVNSVDAMRPFAQHLLAFMSPLRELVEEEVTMEAATLLERLAPIATVSVALALLFSQNPELFEAGKGVIEVRRVVEIFDEWWDPAPDIIPGVFHVKAGPSFFLPARVGEVFRQLFLQRINLNALPQRGHTTRVLAIKRPTGRPVKELSDFYRMHTIGGKQMRLKKSV